MRECAQENQTATGASVCVCVEEMLLLTQLGRPIAMLATQQLAAVDYSVANRVTDGVSQTVAWAYAHDAPWLAAMSVHLLQSFDELGGVLIALVVWLVDHTR